MDLKMLLSAVAAGLALLAIPVLSGDLDLSVSGPGDRVDFSHPVSLTSLDLNSSDEVKGQIRGIAYSKSLAYIAWDDSCIRNRAGQVVDCLGKTDNTGGMTYFHRSYYLPRNQWEKTDTVTLVDEKVVEKEVPVGYTGVASGSDRLYLLSGERVHVLNSSLIEIGSFKLEGLKGNPQSLCAGGSRLYIPGYTARVVNVYSMEGELIRTSSVPDVVQPLGCAVVRDGVWIYGNMEPVIRKYSRQ